ncbi:uncharacterized protein G2W53_001508 [Senna tora]|uniref:Uncharacterized protein n=1 Tax=Senna tora TaxID=362788 RepID=A0A834XJU0_9FABA|nr:uncharacterized protein G2W53_001508 [Senna tora]
MRAWWSYNIHFPTSVTVFGRVIIYGMLRGIWPPISTCVRIRMFRTWLVIWPYDIHTPNVQPNMFMGGVVLGHDAWAFAGNKKEGSALDSPFGGRIGCSGGLNLPLFAHAYTFSIALTVAGYTLACSQASSSPSHCVSLLIVVVLEDATLVDWASPGLPETCGQYSSPPTG